MREILRGLIAGALVSCLRLPLGFDLLRWPAVDSRTALGWRAVALVVVGVGALAARQASIGSRFLLGALIGFAAHGLFLAWVWAPESPTSLAAVAVVGALLLAMLRADRQAPELREPPDPSPRYLEMLGVAAGAAGVAVALEGIARYLRLLGGTLAQDDTVFATVLLGLLLSGAVAFGWIAASKGLRGVSLPVGLAAGAAACFVSLAVLAHLAEERTFTGYVRTFGLDGSQVGTLPYDALLSAACFVAPGIVLGGALLGARGPHRIVSLLVGAALGLSFVPGILALDPGSTASDVQASSAELVPFGVLLASAGAIVAILSLARRGALARWSGIAASLAAAAPAILVDASPVPSFSPWSRRPVFPLIASDLPEGLLTVESFGLMGGSWAYATLDRRTITPVFEGLEADAQRIRASFELLPEPKRSRRDLRVLLVGQSTPVRSAILADCGAARVDRTAAWSAGMERVERAIGDAMTSPAPEVPGEVIDADEARARISRGDYDLVLALAVPGDAPRCRPVEAPEGTTVVRWLELDEPAEDLDLGERVALTYEGLDRPAIALLTNACEEPGGGPFSPLLVAPGRPRTRPLPIEWLRRRKSERYDVRTDAARAAMLQRFADAAAGGPREDLLAGLAIFHAAQVPSSEFEKPEERTELPDAFLARLRKAALAEPPGPFLRRLVESLARTLAGKRWVEEIYAYVQPIAEAYAPWPELEKVLARADLEALAPGDAAERLERLTKLSAGDFAVWALLGDARCALGQGDLALECWKTAAGLPTSDRLTRRRIVLGLLRAGAPEGILAGRKLLQELPADEELKGALQRPTTEGPPGDPCPPR